MPEPNLQIMREEHRSGTRGTSVHVRFVNNTDRVVEIVWINYAGSYIRYKVLKKGEFVDVNTFNSHLWAVFDYYTKDRLHIDKKFVYHPKTINQYIRDRYPGKALLWNIRARVEICITIPLYSLRYRSLLTTRDMLTTEEDAEVLELPKLLIQDLKKVITLQKNLVYTLNSQDLT